jgi:hypothetical protein
LRKIREIFFEEEGKKLREVKIIMELFGAINVRKKGKLLNY